MTGYFRSTCHFENVPMFMRKFMADRFWKNRARAVKVFKRLIDRVNRQWDQTSKPYTFGPYLEDINPEYVRAVQNRIQPALDELNKKFLFVNYRVDEIGDIVGYVPWIPKSKIWYTMEEL